MEWVAGGNRASGFGSRASAGSERLAAVDMSLSLRSSGQASSYPHARIAEARKPKPESRSPKPAYCAINAINAIIAIMASITIRRLPENTKRRLRIRAARNGRSMEQEARELLEAGLARKESEPENLGEAIRRRFAPLGGVDLKIPPRRSMVRDPGIR
jgi:antitoxin FitA